MNDFQLRILGKTWNCRFVDPIPGHNIFGMYMADRCEIHLVKTQDPEQLADTLLHEVLHAIDYTLNMDLTEHQIHVLAAALYAVIADNPELISYLQVTNNEEATES